MIRMWRPLDSVVVLLSLLVSGGCNSTLEEFRCAEASHCIENVTNMGRCEPSGHCSFVDTSCLGSGFRFGGNAGDESGQCVSGDDAIDGGLDTDAAVTDAAMLAPPIARILPTKVGICGLSLTVDSNESEAVDGATIESYTWTLFANDEEIDTFTGAGDAPLERGLHRLGGNHAAPIINLPSYHGLRAVRGNVDAVDERTTLFQSFQLDSASYRLFFAVGMANNVDIDDNEVTVRLATDEISAPLGVFEVVRERFTGHQLDFTVPAVFNVGVGVEARLLFEFEGDGHRWLDNIALVETPGNLNVVTANESFESGSDDPWLLGDGVTNRGGLAARDIESAFRETALYVVRLQVTDSNGLRSEIVEIQVVGTCP